MWNSSKRAAVGDRMDTRKSTTPERSATAARPRNHETADFSMIHRGSVITGPDEASVKEFIASMDASEAKRRRWPDDGRAAMTALARLFPSLRGVPGADPWDVDHLIAWCNSGAPTSGSGWAARFLLGVWNPSTDWTQNGVPSPGRFDLLAAWDCLDEKHRAAIIDWLDAPFWP